MKKYPSVEEVKRWHKRKEREAAARLELWEFVLIRENQNAVRVGPFTSQDKAWAAREFLLGKTTYPSYSKTSIGSPVTPVTIDPTFA